MPGAHGVRDRLVGLPQAAGEAGLGCGEGGGQTVDGGLGAGRVGGIGEHSRAADGRVGGRKAHADRRRRQAASLQLVEEWIERAAGLDGGALPGQRDQEVDSPPRLAQALAGKQALDQGQAAGTCGREVDVRVGAVGDQGVAVRDHGLGQVGVQVEGGDDRDRSDLVAHPAQKFSLAVVQMLGDHGAVQVEEQGVKRAGRLPGRPGAWPRAARRRPR